jgi:NaMN:DMB phosphoribosyltransferase
LSAELSFGRSALPQLQVYDQGYVKEGVGAGASAIVANLYGGWQNSEVLTATEILLQQYLRSCDRAEI